jgi:hypothetical protein
MEGVALALCAFGAVKFLEAHFHMRGIIPSFGGDTIRFSVGFGRIPQVHRSHATPVARDSFDTEACKRINQIIRLRHFADSGFVPRHLSKTATARHLPPPIIAQFRMPGSRSPAPPPQPRKWPKSS